ncbi:ABC transporter permease [Sulfurovum sp. zt1-1]|uniref:ABC transporter permease n=1 Tax=Sulfurovum zhangzhouensis TaxID=3019067 RepID=A0ABT7QW83_9BACT|nr:ABC transporter permease [Sulfurovum zhangzhouensis]MDM5271048.1 ABC transporter permease [Sulfurovum zhangzhouensis]
MWHRLKALLYKEFIQMRRDRLTFAIMIGIPIIQLMIFGFAINTEVKHLPTIVNDQSRSMESRHLLQSFVASGYFDIVAYTDSLEKVQEAIDRSEVKVGFFFPPDYALHISARQNAKVEMIVDASDSMSAASAISTAQLIALNYNRELLDNDAKQEEAFSLFIHPLYNPDFVSAYYMVPGILGIILTITMVMITAISIVKEKEFGTLEQLLVTPMRTMELMLGKIIPYVVIGYFQLTLALLIGILVFQIPIMGSLLLFYVLTTIFILASLSLGILISTLARNQLQAVQLSFFMVLPTILLSGFMFPREAMPPFFYYLGDLFPLTFFLEIVRGILLKGVSIEYLYTPTLALFAFVVILLGISIVIFSRFVRRS